MYAWGLFDASPHRMRPGEKLKDEGAGEKSGDGKTGEIAHKIAIFLVINAKKDRGWGRSWGKNLSQSRRVGEWELASS